jgi:hypothetical protein
MITLIGVLLLPAAIVAALVFVYAIDQVRK